MFLFNLKFSLYQRIQLDNLIEKLKPYLKNGSIILSSDSNILASYLSPTPIKHCSFCYIQHNEYYIIDISDEGYRERTLKNFLRFKTHLYIFHYHDLEIMSKTMNYIRKHKNSQYGFTKTKDYCYKVLFNIYNNAYNNKYKTISEFIPTFQIFNGTYINSNSIILSKDFSLKCCLINNYFIRI